MVILLAPRPEGMKGGHCREIDVFLQKGPLRVWVLDITHSVWTIPGLDACSGPQSPLSGAPPQVTGTSFEISMTTGLSSYPLTQEALPDPLK